MTSAGPVDAPAATAAGASRAGTAAVVAAALLAVLTAVVLTGLRTEGSALPTARAAVLALLGLAAAAVLGGTAGAARLPVGAPLRERLLDLAAAAAGAQTVLAAGTAFLLYLGTAPAPSSPAFGPGLVAFITTVPVGRTWVIAAAAAALLTALLVGVRSRAGVAALWPLAALALVPVALPGALAGTGVSVVRSAAAASFVLLLAVATWTGTAALQVCRLAPRSPSIALSALGAGVVALAAGWAGLTATGAPAALLVAGSVVLLLAGLAALRRLPGVQVVLLGAVTGLAAVAAVTRALPAVADRRTPAEILTGAPLPPSPTPWALVAGWCPDALWLVVAAGLLAAYAVGVHRVGGRWPARRWASWSAGVLVLAWVTSGGPAVYREVLLGAQLGQQLAMLLLVPVLLAGGAPLRLVPALVPGFRAPNGRPVLAGTVAVAVLLVVESGPVLRWSVTDPVGAEASLAVALLAGAWLVHGVTTPERTRGATLGTVGALLGLEVLGAVLLGTGSSLVLADWFGAMGWGTDAVAAQRSAVPAVLPVALLPTLALLVTAVRTPAAAPSRTPDAAVAA